MLPPQLAVLRSSTPVELTVQVPLVVLLIVGMLPLAARLMLRVKLPSVPKAIVSFLWVAP